MGLGLFFTMAFGADQFKHLRGLFKIVVMHYVKSCCFGATGSELSGKKRPKRHKRHDRQGHNFLDQAIIWARLYMAFRADRSKPLISRLALQADDSRYSGFKIKNKALIGLQRFKKYHRYGKGSPDGGVFGLGSVL